MQAIEIGFVADVVQNHADQFVNLNQRARRGRAQVVVLRLEVAAGEHARTARPPSASAPTPARRRSATARTCSRRPACTSDPATLEPEWATWDDFIAFGKQYEASPTKQPGHFVDSAASIFSTAVYQGDEAYNNAEGKPDVDEQRRREDRLGLRHRGAAAKITAGPRAVLRPWNKAFSNGAFAALACPTWMMGYIQGQAGGADSGKWAVAPVLPGGATNWGGSWLGVPTKAQNKAAAIALVEWLSAKQQQITMWTSKAQGGHFPSNAQAAADPAVNGATSAYFSNAPVGEIFGDIASR